MNEPDRVAFEVAALYQAAIRHCRPPVLGALTPNDRVSTLAGVTLAMIQHCCYTRINSAMRPWSAECRGVRLGGYLVAMRRF